MDHNSQERVRQLRSALMEQGDKLAALRDRKPSERGDTFRADVEEAATLVRMLDDELTAVERAAQPTGNGPTAATGTTAAVQLRSAGEAVAQDQLFREWVGRSKGEGSSPAVDIRRTELRLSRADAAGGAEFRALLDSGIGAGTSAGLFIPTPAPFLNAGSLDRLRLFVEDVMAAGTTDAALIRYIRELDPRTTEAGAATVAEGGLKPEVAMNFVEADAPVRKIAAWVPITTELLSDAPALASYVNGRLTYMVELRREAQILNGDGTGANLLGIRQTPGVQAQAGVAGDNASSIALAIGKIENVDGYPNAIAMNPVDFWAMITRRTTTAGVYDVVFNGLPVDTLWGLRVIRTRAIEAGKAVVGDWARGGQIFNRQEATIRVADQHADYFVYNKAVILCETRLAVAWYRPDWFATVTFA